MQIEVDQSGKIEETNKNTVLAFSNGKEAVILIKSRTKRQILEMFRRQGKPKLFIYRTFTAALFLLTKPYLSQIQSITIDIEWTGKERLIADIYSELIQKYHVSHKPELYFKSVGKSSSAHRLALNAYRSTKQNKKKRKTLKVLTLKELLPLVLKATKKDRGLK